MTEKRNLSLVNMLPSITRVGSIQTMNVMLEKKKGKKKEKKDFFVSEKNKRKIIYIFLMYDPPFKFFH